MEIENFEDYLIYRDGRVYSKKRNIFLKQTKSKRGYLTVSLYNKKRKTYNIHRLVGEHYIDNFNNKPFIDHIDGNKLNNNINNLRWVTNIENCNAFQSLSKNNTSGIKNITYQKQGLWEYKKCFYKTKYHKCFINKNDAIWCKFIFELLNK